MRQHYKPEPEQRANAAFDFLCAIIMAALVGAPFIAYFWAMQP